MNRASKVLTVSLVALLATVGVLYGILAYYGRLPWQTNTTTNTSRLDTNTNTVVDLPVVESNRFPVAVMIENLVDIRPQAGLGAANLVYEALVEGGITRFMAVYATAEDIAAIGPIRSARHYFVDWAEEYGGFYAYVGGSPQALGVTNTSDYLTDLNQFYNAEYYYRDPDILAPHNLFSSSELFNFAVRDFEFTSTPGDYRAYLFKQSIPPEERPVTVAPITINYSTSDYQVQWRYDTATNKYIRWNGGNEQLDANTSQPLTASNVLVQRVETTVLEAATGRLDMETIGEGPAVLFRDGAVVIGSWKKPGRGERTLFYDSAGTEWLFNPGPTWIQIVTTETAITY